MNQFLFSVSLFLSASLLFIIQPMVAKILLPVYGGTPAVWTVCMFFFQALLLIAYGYAWVLSRLKSARRWRLVHFSVCLLSIVTLPLAFAPAISDGLPELDILQNLVLQLGLPLLIIASSAPILQYAYSQTTGKRAGDPYFLYAASNIGSLLALLSYPWLVERFSGVTRQFFGWNIVYVAYLVCLTGLLFAVNYEPLPRSISTSTKLDWKRKAVWVFLSFVPCSLMLGVTFYISTDIAATPLFWVLPLALYLLSFVLTFASKPIISHAWVKRNILIILAFPILGFIMGPHQVQAMQLIIFNLIGFFMLALLCHGELVRTRPEVYQLTAFYFCLALGGVLAGCFNGFLAPRLFSYAYEYPLVMLLALLCIPNNAKTEIRPWIIPCLVFGLTCCSYFFPENVWGYWLRSNHVADIVALCLIMLWPGRAVILFCSMFILFISVMMPSLEPAQTLSQQRNFYGVKRVFSKDGAHVLMSQNTLHGFQVQQDENPIDGARAYYGSVFPVIQKLQALYSPLHVMVLGLGTGTMACQFRGQDEVAMVEIDEQMINIASNPMFFTYLRDCKAHPMLIQDDGRLAAARIPDASLELLVMDAFNSDAIPVHLLTQEALALYQKKITSDGVILVNISNRNLRVLPVLTGAGRKLDMIVLHKFQEANNHLGQFASEWALLTTNERLASQLLSEQGWRFVVEDETITWTDDYSNLVPLIKWS